MNSSHVINMRAKIIIDSKNVLQSSAFISSCGIMHGVNISVEIAQAWLTLVRIMYMYCTLQYITSRGLTNRGSATEVLAQTTQEVSLLTGYVPG